MRRARLSFGALALLAGASFSPCHGQAANVPQADDNAVYVAPAGTAPPVAPPVKKGSPLDHLVNDPKVPALAVGYREGRTTSPDYWIAHRFIDAMDGQGWGWIRKSDDGWNSGKWFALQESPGIAMAPKRRLLDPTTEVDCEYKFWGSFADYKAYDPRTDELLPVFILQGYEVIGPANPLRNRVGPPDRVSHRPSGASSRDGRPILSDPGVD